MRLGGNLAGSRGTDHSQWPVPALDGQAWAALHLTQQNTLVRVYISSRHATSEYDIIATVLYKGSISE
jgi:hypothetical protein